MAATKGDRQKLVEDELSMTWDEPGISERKPSLDDYDRRPDQRAKIVEGLELYSFRTPWLKRRK
jgi:hypothetical protein